MHIVQLANFYSPTSGGLRVALDALGREYIGAGHRRTLIVPGDRDERLVTDSGTIVRVAAPKVPGLGGYRAILRRAVVDAVIRRDPPDVVELSDKTTLVACGRRARELGIPVVLVSHERLDAVLSAAVVDNPVVGTLIERYNRRLLRSIDAIVCASSFAAAEFGPAPSRPVRRVPLGVDLELFRPAPQFDHRAVTGAGPARLFSAVRLTADKRPELLVDTSRALVERGVDHTLTVFGDGPLRTGLERRATGLPIVFEGFVADRRRVAAAMALADVGIAPGPAETFGLAALEVMACGTPVVVPDAGSLPEIVGPGGVVASRTARGFADAIESLLTADMRARRLAAHEHASTFTWERSAAAMLAVHGSLVRPGTGRRAQADRSNL